MRAYLLFCLCNFTVLPNIKLGNFICDFKWTIVLIYISQIYKKSHPNWFHFAGGTWAEKSLRTFEYFTNRPRSDIKKIVDWGCGCARVSRHYFDLCNAQIIGLDIDEKMINWCKSELPDGQWITSSPYPPSHLPDNSADLIIGHSVFTHLDEFTQF